MIGQEDPAIAKASKGSIHSDSVQGSVPTAAVPSNVVSGQKSASTIASTSSPNDPPPLNNTITINLSQLVETGDTANNIILQAGDIVTVPHAGIVYVLGAVNHAGGFVLSNDRGQMSALKILSLAGGLTRTAKSDHAVLVRKDNQGQQHEITLDLRKVTKFQAEDVQLQPSDILYVPDSGAKQALLRTIELGIALGTGVALYRVAYH
jgi:protein involved in polysaccharide export with SLBB domain